MGVRVGVRVTVAVRVGVVVLVAVGVEVGLSVDVGVAVGATKSWICSSAVALHDFGITASGSSIKARQSASAVVLRPMICAVLARQ